MNNGCRLVSFWHCLSAVLLVLIPGEGFTCTEQFTNCMEMPDPSETAYILTGQQPVDTYAVGEDRIQNDTAVMFNRVKKGFYNVHLGEIASPGSNVQVSAYAENAYCQLASWRRGVVSVSCVGADTEPINSRFSLLVKKNGRNHYLTHNHNKASDPVNIPRWNTVNWPDQKRAPQITRLDTGSYLLHHSIDERVGMSVQLTAVSMRPAYCNVMGFSSRNLAIQCFSVKDQRPIDSGFTLLIEPESRYALTAWQKAPLSKEYAGTETLEQPTHLRESTMKIEWQSTGLYFVTVGEENLKRGGNVQVTAYQSDAYCSVREWTQSNLIVACYRGSRLFDSGFSLLLIKATLPE
jgi:hypothetical protein